MCVFIMHFQSCKCFVLSCYIAMQNVCGRSCGFVVPGTHPRGTQTMNFSEPSGKRGHRSEPSDKRGHMASPRECKETRKNNGIQKTQTWGA